MEHVNSSQYIRQRNQLLEMINPLKELLVKRVHVNYQDFSALFPAHSDFIVVDGITIIAHK